MLHIAFVLTRLSFLFGDMAHRNEYTDWDRPSALDPLSMRDSLSSALSDALVVAPLMHVVHLHAARSANPSSTFFYHYQARRHIPFSSHAVDNILGATIKRSSDQMLYLFSSTGSRSSVISRCRDRQLRISRKPITYSHQRHHHPFGLITVTVARPSAKKKRERDERRREKWKTLLLLSKRNK